jgi:DNA-binding protein HU-beta
MVNSAGTLSLVKLGSKRRSGSDDAPRSLTKSNLIQTIAYKTEGKLTRKDVKGILESVATIGYADLKKDGVFVVPSLVPMVVGHRRLCRRWTCTIPGRRSPRLRLERRPSRTEKR